MKDYFRDNDTARRQRVAGNVPSGSPSYTSETGMPGVYETVTSGGIRFYSHHQPATTSAKEPANGQANLVALPKWWPKKGMTRVQWKAAYRQLRTLQQKHGDNITRIAKEAKMSRKRVSHIMQWANLSPEAHN